MTSRQRVAVVTGARRGIGFGIAQALAEEGYRVLLSAASPQETGDPAAARLRDAGWDAAYLQCDITSARDRARLIAAARDWGGIDVLVNNAGVAPEVRQDLLSMEESSFDRVMDTNLKGTFFLCQAAAGEMIKQVEAHRPSPAPRIINISSVSSYTASPERGEYCISKAGISMVTKLFAVRLADWGIPVFEIRPGIILTDMTAGVREKYEKLIAEGITPIRRFGTPQDVAGCVLAACSGNLDFTTGQVLEADGGFHLRRL